jgi:hypothetical protein
MAPITTARIFDLTHVFAIPTQSGAIVPPSCSQVAVEAVGIVSIVAPSSAATKVSASVCGTRVTSCGVALLCKRR